MTAPTDAQALLRKGLLEGISMLVARPPAGSPAQVSGCASVDGTESLAAAVASACAVLGARVCQCDATSEREQVDRAVSAALADAGAVDRLVVDGAGLFDAAQSHDQPAQQGARAALRDCLDAAWSVTRAVVDMAFLEGDLGGRILYIAPVRAAGEHADAARAGLENLARTLSIEWARHSITAVTIAPGESTRAGEVAALTAYLASSAGAYFSGCLIDLRGPGPR